MMIRLLFDEHIDEAILAGLRSCLPAADILNVKEAGIRGMSDPDLLEWAFQENRIMVSQDVNTMIDFAYQRMIAGRPLFGLFVFPAKMSIGRVIEELSIILSCSTASEWENRVVHLPL
ncbi:MAG: DUF5615 family PIN-like protein [Acidobacteriota bacterium]|nr:DUF5615 family PIN-like protein [Acidobacteriota bacterium]